MLYRKDSYDHKNACKYFTEYDDYKIGIIPLCIILPQMNTCIKYLKDNKHINI